jgi:nucleotidyltransferase/DNA polymerase involved in DNA repair
VRARESERERARESERESESESESESERESERARERESERARERESERARERESERARERESERAREIRALTREQCQVEQRLDPSLRGVPMAVVQYNPNDPQDLEVGDNRRVDDSDGSLIAVSYEARAAGVKRQMRGKEARRACPDLALVQVPVANKKSDINVYREAGAEVVTVLSRFASACERSSIDEVYLDISSAAVEELRITHGDEDQNGTEGNMRRGESVCNSTWVAGEEHLTVASASKSELRNGLAVSDVAPERQSGLGAWWGRADYEWTAAEKLLAAGAAVAQRMRRAVYEECGFTCSAGERFPKSSNKSCKRLLEVQSTTQQGRLL